MEVSTVSEQEIVNDSGIQSLSGFAYQIRVFVYYMTKMDSKSLIEFETIEDIAVNNTNVNTFLDKNSDSFRSVLKNISGYDAIQVKRTTIADSTKQKILFNWMILESINDNITNYILFTDDAYGNSDTLFDTTADVLYDTVIKSHKKADALISKVKTIYLDDFDGFSKLYMAIRNKYSFISEKDLDAKIMKAFTVLFHKEGVSDLIYALRIKELLQSIAGNIITTIDKKLPFVCTNKEFIKQVEEICMRIADGQYEPDYMSFRKAKRINLSDQCIATSREYRQLIACNLPEKRIEDHLVYQQYYENIKYRYLEDNKLGFVENIENTTYENFCSVKEAIAQSGDDIPINRLNKTKEKDNYYASKNQTRYGSCIHLTKDITDENLKISWEDE